MFHFVEMKDLPLIFSALWKEYESLSLKSTAFQGNKVHYWCIFHKLEKWNTLPPLGEYNIHCWSLFYFEEIKKYLNRFLLRWNTFHFMEMKTSQYLLCRNKVYCWYIFHFICLKNLSQIFSVVSKWDKVL